MLPAPHRLRHSRDFRRVLRRGRTRAARTVVVHAAPADGVCRVGFVVGRDVGTAVRRNRVKRRLRHLVAADLAAIAGTDLVVRARPAAAGADYAELRSDLCRCLRGLEKARS